MKKRYQDPAEELFMGCLGRLILAGMVFGAALMGIIWLIVSFFN